VSAIAVADAYSGNYGAQAIPDHQKVSSWFTEGKAMIDSKALAGLPIKRKMRFWMQAVKI